MKPATCGVRDSTSSRRHAVVADLGAGHRDDLPRVGRIGQHFLIAGHARVEHDLARRSRPPRRPRAPRNQVPSSSASIASMCPCCFTAEHAKIAEKDFLGVLCVLPRFFLIAPTTPSLGSARRPPRGSTRTSGDSPRGRAESRASRRRPTAASSASCPRACRPGTPARRPAARRRARRRIAPPTCRGRRVRPSQRPARARQRDRHRLREPRRRDHDAPFLGAVAICTIRTRCAPGARSRTVAGVGPYSWPSTEHACAGRRRADQQTPVGIGGRLQIADFRFRGSNFAPSVLPTSDF